MKVSNEEWLTWFRTDGYNIISSDYSDLRKRDNRIEKLLLDYMRYMKNFNPQSWEGVNELINVFHRTKAPIIKAIAGFQWIHDEKVYIIVEKVNLEELKEYDNHPVIKKFVEKYLPEEKS